jgi:hypothetical protein
MKINEVTEAPNLGNILKPGNTVGFNVFELPPDERAALNGKTVYHQTRKLAQILKSGGLKPRRDASGEREFALNKLKIGKDWQTPVGIFVSERPGQWFGENIAFEVLPSDKIYKAYYTTGHLMLVNPIPVERFIKKVDETLKQVQGRWALVSKSNPKKVLQYYHGVGRPSDEWVSKVERRVHAFSESDQPMDITPAQLDKLEFYLDQLFARIGIDVEFTRHFLDRVNDERNIRPITLKELAELFKDTYVKYGKRIASMGPDAQAVIKDMRSDINLPFVLNLDSRNKMLDLVAKTVMRKKNFSTPNQELKIESTVDQVRGKEPMPKKSKPTSGGASAHPYRNRLVGEQGYVEPDELGYKPTTLTSPKYTLVVDTPGELDWYKLGQHFATLGSEDPNEFGQSESDVVLTAANQEMLDLYKQELDRLGMTWQETGGTTHQPEIHKELPAGPNVASIHKKMPPQDRRLMR